MTEIIIPPQIYDNVNEYLNSDPDNKIKPEELIGQSVDKINWLVNQLKIGETVVYEASNGQIGYILKVDGHISLEVITPLMEKSEGEFYAVYYEGECYHMGANTIKEITNEIKRLLQWIKKE